MFRHYIEVVCWCFFEMLFCIVLILTFKGVPKCENVIIFIFCSDTVKGFARNNLGLYISA